MSLILEALRKSEERRRLGEAPTLISQSEWTARRHHAGQSRRRAWLAWLLLPVVAIALAAGWWIGLREAPVDPATTPSVETPARAPEVPGPPVPVAAAPTTPPATPATHVPSTTGTPAQTADTVPPDLRARFERGEVFANAPEQLRPPVPTTDAPIVPPEAALPEPLEEPREAAVAAVPAPPPPPTSTIAAPTTPAPVATAPATPAVPAAAPASPGASVPYVFELSLATRQALPALKLSMHVFAAEPASRFVLLDGERLVEGGLSGELRVIEIRTDGVVLEFRGERFLLPRSGG